MPATALSGLALKVPGWAIVVARSSSRSDRPATAPDGSPPAITLPRTLMSGMISSTACMPPGEMRKPVTTSSKTSTLPVAVHAARAAAMNDLSSGSWP